MSSPSMLCDIQLLRSRSYRFRYPFHVKPLLEIELNLPLLCVRKLIDGELCMPVLSLYLPLLLPAFIATFV